MLRSAARRPAQAIPAVAVVLTLLAFAHPRTAVGATYTVTSLGDFHDYLPGDGICSAGAADPSCSLRAAIEQANQHAGTDTVLFQGGLNGTISLTLGLISITESINVTGPGRDLVTVDAGDASGIFYFTGVSLQLSRLTLTGSNGSGGAVDIRGSADSVQLTELRFDHNHSNSGGAVSTLASAPLTELILEDVELDSNSATFSGGAIYLNTPGASLNLTDCSFFDNWAGDPEVGAGGAVTVRVNGSASVDVQRTLFSGNSALGGGSGGGALNLQRDSSGTLSLTVDRSAFVENSAASGGAIFLTDGGAIVTNSTFANNQGSGSAFLGLTADLILMSSTVAGNTGGVALVSAGATTVQLGHTLIAHSGAACSGPALTSLGYNIATGTACNLDQPSDLNDTDPLLGPLMQQPLFSPAFVPYTVSPAVDSGDPGGCPLPALAAIFETTLAIDQWGQSRPWDGDGDTVAYCDRGAIEAHAILYDGFETHDESGWSSFVP